MPELDHTVAVGTPAVVADTPAAVADTPAAVVDTPAVVVDNLVEAVDNLVEVVDSLVEVDHSIADRRTLYYPYFLPSSVKLIQIFYICYDNYIQFPLMCQYLICLTIQFVQY